MAKIDLTKIEGYQNMSAEEKLAALEAMDLPEPDYSGYVKKDLYDKASSEIAQYKKSLRERMTEEEAAKIKADEEMASIREELEMLRTEKVIGENASKFIEMGYDSKLAQATAVAMVKGETDTVFKNHAKFLAEREKALRAEILKSTPTPPPGEGGETLTKEDFRKMSFAEKARFAQDNPEKYKELYGGK